jgi:pyridoxal phosphate enzyme (YggS family)
VSDSLLQAQLRERIGVVEERLCSACRRAGRERSSVTLVAVTKSAPDAVLPLLAELGLYHLGENRPQELWRKSELLAPQPSLHWHLIGHLQRNKIDRTLPLVHLIHSVDSPRLLQSLEGAAAARNCSADVLLEVNTSGESSKMGFTPTAILEMSLQPIPLSHLRIRGLMTMAALEDDPEKCRPSFALLRRLRDQLAAAISPIHPLEHLSMGMSNDFEIAIEEGATLVRIGSALFEGIG